MSFLFALLHFIAFAALAGILIGEYVLLAPAVQRVSLPVLKRLDALYGLVALVVVGTGITRIFLEKGWTYYSTSHVFWAKMALFAAVGLLSIYPTVRFIRMKQANDAALASYGRLRRMVLVQLFLVPLIIFCAIWMARGIY